MTLVWWYAVWQHMPQARLYVLEDLIWTPESLRSGTLLLLHLHSDSQHLNRLSDLFLHSAVAACVIFSCLVCRAFQLLGLALGGGGGMERLHWLLERAFDEDINQLNQTFVAVSTISFVAWPPC